jgi:hypothetical protein
VKLLTVAPASVSVKVATTPLKLIPSLPVMVVPEAEMLGTARASNSSMTNRKEGLRILPALLRRLGFFTALLSWRGNINVLLME